MSQQTIDRSLAIEFSRTFHELAAQRVSRVRPYVEVKQMRADEMYYDRIGTVEARKIEGRYQNATFDSVEHSRRVLPRERYAINLPIDKKDELGSFLEYPGQYASVALEGLNRQMDRIILDAAFADVRVATNSKTPDTDLDFASDGVIVVDATAGLTKAKLLEVQQNFINNEVGVEDDDKMFMTITGAENTSLLNEVTFTSSDFTLANQGVSDNNMIMQAQGFKFIHFGANAPKPILQTDTGAGERFLVASTMKGLCLGINQDIEIEITERDDKIDTVQVQAIMTIGALRTEGKRVQRVRVTL